MRRHDASWAAMANAVAVPRVNAGLGQAALIVQRVGVAVHHGSSEPVGRTLHRLQRLPEVGGGQPGAGLAQHRRRLDAIAAGLPGRLRHDQSRDEAARVPVHPRRREAAQGHADADVLRRHRPHACGGHERRSHGPGQEPDHGDLLAAGQLLGLLHRHHHAATGPALDALDVGCASNSSPSRRARTTG
jgi:hypothetical protein